MDTKPPTPRRLIAPALLLTIAIVVGASNVSRAQSLHRGVIEYEISCLPCHGLDGRGKGPEAKNLTKAPSDLTTISRGNKGVFPTQRIIEMIDGRAFVAAHGQRDMPVWGDRYRVRADPSDTDAFIDKRARTQIEALVAYVRSIQKK